MDPFPPSWTDAADAGSFWQRLRRAQRSLLMLDYDGTLAPFHEDRMKACMYPGLEERLITLTGLADVHMVLVTGRSARELRGLLPAEIKADIWGSHGRELLKSDQSYKLFALDSVQQATMQRVIREMTALGFPETLEIKPSSLAVHWRSCEPALREEIRARIESVFDGLAEPGRLHLLPFDGGLEVRSNDRTKGTAVREILRQEAVAVPAAYLGDDLTDEDAFSALGNRGLPILVRTEKRRSCARYWLRPPEELLAFLDGWIAASAQHRGAEAQAAEAPR
jgi:trehalose-phosphatase